MTPELQAIFVIIVITFAFHLVAEFRKDARRQRKHKGFRLSDKGVEKLKELESIKLD